MSRAVRVGEPEPSPTCTVPTFGGDLDAVLLGPTLIHEHIFVGHQELDLNLPHPEWDEDAAIEDAVAGLTRLHALGIRSVLDLTVPGLGRDVARVARVAQRSPVTLLAATGYYTDDTLPPYFRTHGPGRLVGGGEPLEEMFLTDLLEGIAGTGIRASAIKVVSDLPGFTPDVMRVFDAAVAAHAQTGVAIMTHSHAPSGGGRSQLRYLCERGVAPDRIVIGHCGDTTDLDLLMSLADEGAWLGLDRFGMTHVLPDRERIATLISLIERGYADRIVMSHDAAFFSRVTPPSWRRAHAPDWHMENISRSVLPALRAAGVSDDVLDRLLIDNPRRVLVGDSVAS